MSEPYKHGDDESIAIMMTQAFCPNGHNLVGLDDARFDGNPGISIKVEAPDWSGAIVLSPYQGDPSKVGMATHVKEGTKCRISCPVCNVELPVQVECGCADKGDLVALYLRKDLAGGDMVSMCNVFGCHHSKVMDNWHLVSEYLREEDA